MPGRTVTIDSVLTTPVATVRVSGTLQFDPGKNTQLAADTVVVDPAGTLLMGTKAQPIQPGVVAQMTFTGNAPIDTAWDPLMISRGLISLGTAEIYGSYVTSHLTLAVPPMAGDTSLQLSAAPAGWQPGDTLVLAGTHFTGTSQTQDERLQVASIQGSTVYLTSPVRYDHDVPTPQSLAAKFGQAPPGAPLTVDVGDLTRNVRFVSQNPGVLADRGHVMFMHTQQEAVVNAGFYGLGRTDKSVPIGPTNPRGRYALHFHMDGTDGAPIVASGLAVDGSPGWGIVNHSSNVDVTDSVVYGAVGAAFVTEAGDERGSFRELTSRSTARASPDDNPDERRGPRRHPGLGLPRARVLDAEPRPSPCSTTSRPGAAASASSTTRLPPCTPARPVRRHARRGLGEHRLRLAVRRSTSTRASPSWRTRSSG